jgi:hypothetical protein
MCMPLALVNRQRGDEVTAAAQNIPIGHSKKTGREAVRTGHNGGYLRGHTKSQVTFRDERPL